MSLPRSVQQFIDSMIEELPDDVRVHILSGEVRPIREVIRRQFGEHLETDVLVAFLGRLIEDEEKRGRGFIMWSCGGVAIGMISKRTIVAAMGRLRSIGKIQTAGDDYICRDSNLGMFLENMVVELRAAGTKVQIQIDPGHLFRHGCGRAYTPAQWGDMPVKKVKIESASGKGITMPNRLCGCGEYAGYSSLKLVDVEEVCNARGGTGLN